MSENEKPSLDHLRQQIDRIDRELQSLINDRASLATEVRRAKGQEGSSIDFYRPEREAQVLRAICERNTGPLSDEEMVRLFREIMSSCLAQQDPLKIAFLGPEGTFSQSACFKHFGHAIRSLPLNTIEDVFSEVEKNHADFGVVPVENSTEGAVNNTLDMFIGSPLKICGEIELAIHHNLLTQGDSLSNIERVYSHRQSLAQCRGWLRQNLPDAERIPVSSNAEAARRVKHAPDAAAIASVDAGDIYGLHLLHANIEDRPDNTTRFLVLGRQLLNCSGEDKTSLLMSTQDRPGALYHLLQPLADCGVTMTRIESRPSKQGKWDYVFFLDVEGHAEDDNLAAALEMLRPVTSLLKVLGSYPHAVV